MVDEISRRALMEVYWGSADERETAQELGRRYPVAVMPEMVFPDFEKYTIFYTGMMDFVMHHVVNKIPADKSCKQGIEPVRQSH